MISTQYLAVLLFVPFIANGMDPIPGDSARISTPAVSDTSASAGTADVEWSLLQALIRGQPSGTAVFDVMNSGPDAELYFSWQEASNRLLRNAGLRFYRTYSNDPRRWAWLVATLQRNVSYHADINQARLSGPAIQYDTIAKRVWEEQEAGLIAALLAAKDATAAQKGTIAVWDVARQVRDAFVATWPPQPRASFDLPRWSQAVLDVAAKFPNESSGELRSMTTTVVRFAQKDSIVGPQVIASLRSSPNSAVRMIVNADLALAEAQRTPIQLRFTALDGRDIDLAKMRGKVVVIDFSAYTWCGACRIVEKDLLKTYEQYRGKGMEVIGFALENAPSDKAYVNQYVKTHNIEWPLYFEGNGMGNNPYVQRFGFVGVPVVFVLDRRGLLVGQAHGSGAMQRLEPVIRAQLEISKSE